jgi:Protein of unknown function (DUF3631)
VLAGRSAGWSEEDRLATLLGDIRQIFAERADTEGKLPSSKLVDELVAIEGRPWAEYGKARKPISQNQVARLLRRVGVAPEVAHIGNKTARTYQLHQFAEAFERYLPLEGASEPKHRNKCDEIRTSDTFQTVTPEPDVAVAECEKSNNDGLCYGVTVEGPGLDWRAIDAIAREIEGWAHGRRDSGDTDSINAQVEGEIRRRLIQAGILPEAIPIEVERVLQCLFEGQEARRSQHTPKE